MIWAVFKCECVKGVWAALQLEAVRLKLEQCHSAMGYGAGLGGIETEE